MAASGQYRAQTMQPEHFSGSTTGTYILQLETSSPPRCFLSTTIIPLMTSFFSDICSHLEGLDPGLAEAGLDCLDVLPGYLALEPLQNCLLHRFQLQKPGRLGEDAQHDGVRYQPADDLLGQSVCVDDAYLGDADLEDVSRLLRRLRSIV